MNKYLQKSFIAALLGGIISFYSCTTPEQKQTDKIAQDTIRIEPIRSAQRDSFLGVDVEDYDVVHDKIPCNQTLSVLLQKYGITSQQVYELEHKSLEVFNVRKIRGGNDFHIIQTIDSVPITKYFIYEINPTEYVTYGFTDSTVTVQRSEKKLQRRVRFVCGEIESSLWNSIVGQGVPFDLALQLSTIYAWNIDFFGLQKGDKYRVQYEEVLCDSSFVRIDSIKVAKFTHCGNDYYAIPFEQNGRQDYFDYDGSNLRKAFLKAPLSYRRISSHFTHKRFHPVLKYYRPHHGVDYAAPAGTPVSTIGDGRVIFKGWTKGGGNTVKIAHNSMYTTSYMHLSKYGKISQGSFVKQGEVIGYVGSTGVSTGPHLDFRVYQNGTPVNPLSIKSPPVDPIDSTNMEAFAIARDSLIKLIQ